jgi:hypothetical protein
MYTKHELQKIDYLTQHDQLHHVPFRGLQHWAIQVGERIFEVTSNDRSDGKPIYRMIDRSGPKGWWESHTYNKMMVVDRFMGFTDYATSEIDVMSKWIWSAIMKQQYFFLTTNCQTFASILRNLIVDNTGLQPEMRAQLDSLPRQLNPIIMIFERANRVRQLAAASGRLVLLPFRSAKPSTLSAPPKLPVRLSSSWLLALRKAGRQADVQSDQDMFTLLRAANRKQSAERCNIARRDLTLKINRSQTSP